MDLVELVKEVLNFKGFVIEYEGVPLRARKGDTDYTIVLIREPSEREFVEHMETDGKLLVISLDSSREKIGDEFWERKTFEKMLGRALLSKALGREKHGGTIIESFEGAFVEYKEPVASAKDGGIFEKEMEEAFSSSQELRPFYAYYFDVDDREEPESGILLVSAIDGRVYRAADRLVCDTGALSSLQRMEPIIGGGDAVEAAIDFLVGEHTREENVVKEEGTVTLMEKRVIVIERDKIGIKPFGMLYIPFLKLENPEGVKTEDMSGIISQKNY